MPNIKEIKSLIESNQLDEAEQLILENLKENADNIMLYINLCKIYDIKNDWEKLSAIADTVIDTFPNKFQGYKYKAVYLREMENFPEADSIIFTGIENLTEEEGEGKQWLLVEFCKNAERQKNLQLLRSRLKFLLHHYPKNSYIDLERFNSLKEKIKEPIISVVVPIFNVENYLEKSLGGIINQSLKNIEIICVDDGSTDKSLSILEKYAKQDNRIIILKQENQGAGVARNYGMSIARGEYITFLDSDDIYEPTMLEKLYYQAIKENLDIAVCRADLYKEETNEFITANWTIHDNLIPEQRPFSSLDVEKNFFMTFVFWPWDKLYKKSYIEELDIQFQDTRTTNDLFFVAAALLKANRINFLDDILVHHVKRYEQNSSTKSSLSESRELSWNHFYYALIELKIFMKKHKIYAHFEQDFTNYCLHLALWNLESLSGRSYSLLYKALHDEYFEELSVKNHTAGYFYSKVDFYKMKSITSLSLEHHMMNLIFDLEKKLDDNLNKSDIIEYMLHKQVELENKLIAQNNRR